MKIYKALVHDCPNLFVTIWEKWQSACCNMGGMMANKSAHLSKSHLPQLQLQW